MYRATTPQHIFVFEDDPRVAYNQILITYAQDDRIVLEKGKDDLVVTEGEGCDGATVYEAALRLTQEEANLFNSKSAVKVQIRAKTYMNEVIASERMTVSVHDVLNDEVME